MPVGPLSALARTLGVVWRPGDHVAASRALGGAPGPVVHAGSKGMVIEVSPGRRCTVRFHCGPVLTGLSDRDIVAIPQDMRC
jgi:hypothetical protein